MRCKSCDYPLWQLTDRLCPECGTPFLPSEHEFILNSVRFCCPHCEQPYYGTGEKGHLVPRTFACVKCAKFIDMDQMVLLPTEGVTERQTQVTVVPWVERRDRGWFAAFFVTLGLFFFLWFMISLPAGYLQEGGDVLNYLSLSTHFSQSMNNGTINLGDIVYYLSLTALGLFVGTTAVEIRRWR